MNHGLRVNVAMANYTKTCMTCVIIKYLPIFCSFISSEISYTIIHFWAKHLINISLSDAWVKRLCYNPLLSEEGFPD